MKIISGNSNIPLAESIATHLGMELTKANIKRFSDQEIWVEIQENVRGEDVYVIQPTANPTNDNVMELLIVIDALKRASAQRIVAVIPYFGYARQDRKPGPRTPITAKLVANLITTAGADKVLTMDLHAGQIQGFFDIPTDNLFASPVLVNDIKNRYKNYEKVMVVSPDVGGVVRARAYASRIDVPLAIIDKRREKAGMSEVMNVIGDVKDYHCIFVDDIVDSAGTLCTAAATLIKKGAKSTSAYVSHGVFSGPAIKRINDSPLEHVITTDSICETEAVKNCEKIIQISIAPLFAKAIRRIHEESSVSVLFS
ncbi:MAG: ribose-phosphate pyrophosphokinase [Emcibacteraceae bacterium]|jgi:ribose-phosphate pyrophosphokinase|nr:ribose-phosphate pyrophosphokinase [Kordiimonadaceae bacterium]MBT6468001.1 ribose-phosphate pyrophosphokinase [Kordiimonadaceae bacterium]MDB4219449.1 ribose-phosphate pyrophosphokinase [Emcibacteraceae bacterium]MDC0111738.1 ribose-phosphate pyrophosphokinase [Emcibacteraceae bacterium]MDC1429730.1 ribose-phosphate pyrophosphokinase [Emcibacteraceae bacterium]|tara:strand:+ start:15159 stop:16094 length:936 start_codon:yes stop_codon:yes gene_type:complete